MMKKHIKDLFKEIENILLESIKNIDFSKEEIYVCGFWLFYCDYTVLAPPCFAYNHKYDKEYERWSPPEWHIDVENLVYDALYPIYSKISYAMDGEPEKAWEELIQYQWNFYSKICQKLNNELNNSESPFSNWTKSKDFVVGIFEEREDEEIYRKLVIDSVGEDKAAKLCII